jgi:hypothetical protein
VASVDGKRSLMGKLLPSDSIGAPARWHLVFQPVAELWWVNWLCPGRFKHVRAFGLIPDSDVWIFLDVGFRKIELFVATGRQASATIGKWIEGATVIAMAPRKVGAAPPLIPFLCTTAIGRLLGLPVAAWRPDVLYEKCLRFGATHVGRAAPAGAGENREERREVS